MKKLIIIMLIVLAHGPAETGPRRSAAPLISASGFAVSTVVLMVAM